MKGLVSEGWKKWQAGDSTTALRLLDLAADLAPNDTDVQRWRHAVILGPPTDAAAPPAVASADPSEIAATLADAGANDFEARRTLDATLARSGQFDRSLTMWNEYLAAHPQEGRAFLARGRVHYQLHHLAEAKADATKACELGVSEGCARAKQVRVP